MRPLGRRIPTDFKHLDKHPTILSPVLNVERTLVLPSWHWTHDQGKEGSCIGHGSVMERAITNTAQNVLLRYLYPTRRYDPISLWNQAKVIDEWPDTNPGDDNGTSVRAAYDVLRILGARKVKSMRLSNNVPVPRGLEAWNLANGVVSNEWAAGVDQMRAAIASKTPVTIGVNWYEGFDTPQLVGNDWTVTKYGKIRGGHCVCVYGASDKRQAFKFKNSWGKSYPLAWIPYGVMQRLLNEQGEACISVDR